ncbi:stemmadenine O-acetyltransferase-like [Silene latifolia]|uniref:stemmadenine O-acetyltransferase-like n=1 Tax=Silene latifolia TaxID=37657 RepID=UPI003D780E18
MAKISVEIKSKDMIKPFSETPNHLKTLQLSLIDQFAPPVHPPCILFYQTKLTHNINSETTTLLKNSLSETLVQFYPLAGRIQGNLSINCNDEGVEYYEADVLQSLAEVIANPDPEELIRLLPFPPLNTNKSIVTAVQVNHFSCGGMAISISISHKIADAATSAAFINAWALTARGVSSIDQTKLVSFDTASFFPPMDLDGIFGPVEAICREKIVTRRFIFDKEKLNELKSQCDLQSPTTRMSVVSAFIWKKLIKIAKAKSTPVKIFGALQFVNLRTIKNSPIPQNYCGNLFQSTLARTSVEPEIESAEAVNKLRTAVKQIDTSYLPKIKTGECFRESAKFNEMVCRGEAESCAFSSWIRYPLYEINFGWGKPIWVSTTTLPFKNMVCLLPTKSGEGIEAWMNVLEHDFHLLEQDHEFRSLVLHNNIRAKL